MSTLKTPPKKRKRYPKGPAKPGEARAPKGRPCLYTPEIAAEVLNRMGGGETLTSICRDAHLPSDAVIWDWSSEDRRPNDVPATFASDFARARARGHDAIAAGTLEIADDGRNDWMERHGEDSLGWAINGEHVSRSKLRIETRLKLLAKWDKRYGDRVALTGEGGGPIRVLATSKDEDL